MTNLQKSKTLLYKPIFRGHHVQVFPNKEKALQACANLSPHELRECRLRLVFDHRCLLASNSADLIGIARAGIPLTSLLQAASEEE